MASSPALSRPERPAVERTLDAGPLASLRLVPDLPDRAGALPLAAPSMRSVRLPSTDEQLAACVAAEGQAPFAILYERHRADLQRYCLSVVRDRDDAADAANEAWLRAFAALSSPRMRPISFRAWLYSIARNACTDRLRERGRFSLQELGEEDLGDGESAAQQHETRESVRLLLRDLAVLSERQRSAISLREVAGLSLDEIAAALETTPPKVMTLVAEARRVLHERQAGRRLPCDAVRRRIDLLRVSSHRIRAHLDDCAVCRAHHASTRGHRLSSLGLLPIALLRPALDRVLHLFRSHVALGSAASKLAATGSIAIVAGAAVAVHGVGGHSARPHARLARAAAGRVARTTAGAPRHVQVRSHAAPAPRALRRTPVRATAGSVRPAARTASGPAARAPHVSATATPAHPLSTEQSTAQALTKTAAQLTDLGRNTSAAVQQTAQTLTSAGKTAAGTAVKPVTDAAGHL